MLMLIHASESESQTTVQTQQPPTSLLFGYKLRVAVSATESSVEKLFRRDTVTPVPPAAAGITKKTQHVALMFHKSFETSASMEGHFCHNRKIKSQQDVIVMQLKFTIMI